MHADTGAWKALPEIPWSTQAGATYKELGRATARLLADIRAKLATAGPVELALLADQVSDLRVDLRDLAQSELVPQAIYKAAAQATGRRAPGAPSRDHLRLLSAPHPDRGDDAAGGTP
jgi:hypothetical protein